MTTGRINQVAFINHGKTPTILSNTRQERTVEASTVIFCPMDNVLWRDWKLLRVTVHNLSASESSAEHLFTLENKDFIPSQKDHKCQL